jgi:multiple sugar transport system permease protein
MEVKMIPPKKKKTKRARREQRTAYVLLIPAFLGLSFITYLPLIAVILIGFTNLRIGHFVPGGNIAPLQFVGFSNFIDIFQNPSIDFMNSIKVTVSYALLAVVLSIIYSFFIALLLNRKIPARGFFRAVFYIPYILPATSVIITWNFLLRRDGGIVNHILASLGFERSYFLSSTETVIPTLAMIAVWTCGNLIVIFLAGLQNVPRVFHEAADIDGANGWQKFWKITVPFMTPIIFYNLLMSLVINIQIVVPALAVTSGGPGKSTVFMTFLMYTTAFRSSDFGRAGAIAFVFFIVAAILAAILFATSKTWIFLEEGEDKK